MAGMTNEPEVARLVVRGIGDLLDVVPALLGFHPADSLVAVLLVDGRVKVTARLDLCDATDAGHLDLSLGPLLSRFPSATWFWVAYTSDAGAAWEALEVAVSFLPWEVDFETVHVADHRWFLSPDDPGVSHDPTCSALAAEAAYQGLRVLPDRNEIARTLRSVAKDDDLERALAGVIRLQPAEAVSRALELVTASMRTGAAIDLGAAALLAVAAHSPRFADAVITGIDRANARRAQQLWAGVVRGTHARTGGAAAVILGMAAWVSGDGALQNVCLDLAEPFVPESPWFRFLELANRVALPPSEWEGVRLDLLQGLGAA